jgi:hypothetical protein
MKMVKSLLLVSAAGLVASSGAQAADLPVKAKPVEYVKVCSLYGAGFYYIPGTDICLKLGMAVRAEWAYGNVGASLTNLGWSGVDGQSTRITGPDYNQRARTYLHIDTRQQTAYGTLRAYMNVGFTTDFPGGVNGGTSGAGLYANRAFIQLAGFTWGIATSYYDFYSSPATSYSVPFSSDTGDGGWKVAAYTAQLGNGVSATLSLEEPRRQLVINTSIPSNFVVGAVQTSADTAKVTWPDIVGNLRVDQAWGSAQLMGALHAVNGGYYGVAIGGSQNNGAPEDEIGFAVGAGIKINFPMIGPGDYFQAQVNYTEGASRYAAATPAGVQAGGGLGNLNKFEGGNIFGLGYFADGVFCGSATNGVGTAAGCPAAFTARSAVELTTVWSVQAAYEHFWTPTLRTSLVGAYTDVSFNDNASQMMCTNVATAPAATANTINGPITGCGPGSFDWSSWSVSSRTQWNITKEFYVGLEGFYGRLQTMSKGQTVNYTQLAAGAQPTGVRTFDDQDIFVYRMRVHRDIVP